MQNPYEETVQVPGIRTCIYYYTVFFYLMNVFYIAFILEYILNENCLVCHVLDAVPLIDGHNDLPNNLYEKLRNNLSAFDFDRDLSEDYRFGKPRCEYCYTDLPRLRKGKVGAQFWAAYVPCETQYKDAVARTLEQIDVIKRLVRRYPNDLQLVTSVAGVWDAFNNSKLACFIAVEGGHSIDSRLAVLRMYYDLGVRYLTLTHACSTPWADNSWEARPVNNLTKFGEVIIKEMNRMGMLVDLSHVSPSVMMRTMKISRAPVIFSHSAAYTLSPHNRNVPDKVLRLLKKNNGIIMVVFHNEFVASRVMEATIGDVAKHINYIVDLIGMNHVGIGADYDGVPFMPEGLEDVSKYPDLFDYLQDHNPTRWTSKNLRKLAALNFLRVLRAAERVTSVVPLFRVKSLRLASPVLFQMRDRLRNEDEREHRINTMDLRRAGPQAFKCRTA